jgi:adenylylsulfate kinase
VKPAGFTIWLTGLPSSGKSTLATLLHDALVTRGLAVEVLDGDEVRRHLTKDLGFTKEDRDENIRRVAYVAKLLTRVGAVAIAATISPYRDMRAQARAEIGNFVEIHVNCSLAVCMQRDVKGLYASAMRGDIKNFTGISDPYEAPLNPEVVVNTAKESAEESMTVILERLAALGYVAPESLRPARTEGQAHPGSRQRDEQ